MALAAYYFPYLVIIIVLNIKETKTNMPSENKNVDMRAHLKFESVSNYCAHRDDACRSTNTNVCAVKMVKQKRIYKDFVNGCYLFLSNMCDHPGDEYYIAASGSCEQYLTTRRETEPEDVPTASADEAGNKTNSSENFSDNDNVTVTDAGALREKSAPGAKSFVTKYSTLTAFDDHICPLSCPSTYDPVCINVNRGFGKHLKFLTFVNHCTGDIYYCKNFEEFVPPPGEEYEMVQDSGLGWSFCAANSYIQFARFSEAASSMGHYGWLAGDHRYSHIMEPHQRIPGFG